MHWTFRAEWQQAIHSHYNNSICVYIAEEQQNEFFNDDVNDDTLDNGDGNGDDDQSPYIIRIRGLPCEFRIHFYAHSADRQLTMSLALFSYYFEQISYS